MEKYISIVIASVFTKLRTSLAFSLYSPVDSVFTAFLASVVLNVNKIYSAMNSKQSVQYDKHWLHSLQREPIWLLAGIWFYVPKGHCKRTYSCFQFAPTVVGESFEFLLEWN